MSKFTILTYNLCFGKALGELIDFLKQYQPDIVCVQEFEINRETIAQVENVRYELADYSHSFFKFLKFFGVATFYNPKTIEHRNGEVISLSRSLYEFVLFLLHWGRHSRTVLHNEFIIKKEKARINVYNLHLTVHGTNAVRSKQVKQVIQHIKRYNNAKTIIIGDFNYPYKRKGFEKLFATEKLKEATNNILFSLESRVWGVLRVRLKTDYVLYKGLRHLKTEKINRQFSDHFPILTRFKV